MMADFKPDVVVTAVDVGSSHRRQAEQHDFSGAGAGGSSSGGAGSSHKTNLLGRLASFFGRNRSSGGGSGSGSSGASSSSKKRRGGAPSRGNKAVVVLKAKSMNDLAFPVIESWQQNTADPSSAEQHHADREQLSTVPVASSASNDSLFGLREAASAGSVEDVPDGGGWGRLAVASRALSQSADTLSPPDGGAGIAAVSSSLPSSGADGKLLPVGLGISNRQLIHTDSRQPKQRPVSAVISAVSEDDGLPWSSVDSVSSTPPTSGVEYDSSRRAASRGTVVGAIAAALPASKRFMFASDSMLSSTHRNSDSGILSDRSTDTEEEFFRDPWRASQHAGSRRHLSSDSDSDIDAIDLDIITKTEALSNPGARHKQLLRPKKSKSSVPAMPKVEEKNVLEIASCFGADGSRRQPPTATASFGDAEVVEARLSNGPAAYSVSTAAAAASSAAATMAAPTSGHRRLSAANSVPPSLLSREVSDTVRSRRRSSSDAAKERGTSHRTTEPAAQAVATTEDVAASPYTGSPGETPVAPAAGTSACDVSSSLPHDDRLSEGVEHAKTIRSPQPKEAAPGGALPRETAAEMPLVDFDIRPSSTGRLPSASVALVSSSTLSPVPDVAGTDTSVPTAAAAVPAAIANESDLLTGAAVLAKYKSMFKQKSAIASVTAPADGAAANSPGDHNSNESMSSTNLASAKPPQSRRLQTSAAGSRLATLHPTTETESHSVAAPMTIPLPADSVVPVMVVSAKLAPGLTLPEQPATFSITTEATASDMSPLGTPGGRKGLDKLSGISLPSGSVSKPVKLLPSTGLATTKPAPVSERSSLPITRASRASQVGIQVLPSSAAAAAATAVAEKAQQALPSSGPPAEGREAAVPPHRPHNAVGAAVIGEPGGPTSSSVSRADQSREPLSLRHNVSSRRPQEISHIPKVAAAVPAEPTTMGIATAHTPGPERAPAAAAATAVAVGCDGDSSYKRKSVRELVSQSSPAPMTGDAAAVRPGLSHGPSVRRQLQPPLPRQSSTHQQSSVTAKEQPSDRAEDASAAGFAMAASRQPVGAPAAGITSVLAAPAPGYSGASSNGSSGTATGRESTVVLAVSEPSTAGEGTTGRGSTPVTLLQPRHLSIGRLPSSRGHNADQAAAATVVGASSATVSSHHRAASSAQHSCNLNATTAVSKLALPSPARKPSRGLAGSNISWTQERSRGYSDDALTSGSTSPVAQPDELPKVPRPIALGSLTTALPDVAQLDSSPAAVSAEKAASVKDRMKLFQRH